MKSGDEERKQWEGETVFTHVNLNLAKGRTSESMRLVFTCMSDGILRYLVCFATDLRLKVEDSVRLHHDGRCSDKDEHINSFTQWPLLQPELSGLNGGEVKVLKSEDRSRVPGYSPSPRCCQICRSG